MLKTMDCMLALSVVSDEIACENAENCPCRQPHYRLTPPPQGTSAKPYIARN